jgi:hypothetical protein
LFLYVDTYHADPDELLCMVEASLQQLGEVVVLGRADEAGDVDARERTRTRVEVGQQDAKRIPVELNHCKLKSNNKLATK